MKDKSFDGASCVDCHAPGGLHHGILRDENVAASTHVSNLPQTCGQAGCHKGYAQSVASKGFLLTDLHNAAWIGVNAKASVQDLIKIPSTWKTAFYIFGPLCALFMLGSLYWGFFGDVKKLNKNANNSLLGAEKFQTIIIGSKGKQSAKETGRWFKFKRFIGSWFGNQDAISQATASKPMAQSHKTPEKSAATAEVVNPKAAEQPASNPTGVSEAGALARMERKRLRAEAAAAAAGGNPVQPEVIGTISTPEPEQPVVIINSGSTEAGMLARMERKRKRAEAAAAVGGGEVTPAADAVPVLDSNPEVLEEAKPELVLNSGSTEAGMLARMERKRLRAEAAAKQAAGGDTSDSEKPK